MNRILKKLIEENKFHELVSQDSLKPNFLIKYLIFSFYEIIKLIFFQKQNYDLIQANSTPQFKGAIAAFILRIKLYG